MDGRSNFCPAMAVPITVKIPEPITAPIPNAVRDQGPRLFLRECSGSSESRISLSMDLRASSWLARAVLLVLSEPGSPFPPDACAECSRYGSPPEVLRPRKSRAGTQRSAVLADSGWPLQKRKPLGGSIGLGSGPAALGQAGLEPISSTTGRLALRLTARQLLDLLLLRSARLGLLRLRCSFLARCPLQLLPFLPVFDLGGIRHV